MSDTPDANKPSARFPTFWRLRRSGCWGCLARGLLVVLLVAGLVDGVATIYYGVKLRGALEQLRAQGKPINAAQASPPPVAASQNAAPLYLQAVEIIRPHVETKGESKASYEKADWSKSEDIEVLGRFVAEDARALELVEQASRRPSCRFNVDWEDGFSALLPHLSQVRTLARFLAASVAVAADGKDAGLAMDRLEAGFRMAAHVAREPHLIGQLVAYAMDGTMVKAASYALPRVRPTEDACRRLADILSQVDYQAAPVKAIAFERAIVLHEYARVSADPVRGAMLLGDNTGAVPGGAALWWLYTRPLRPLFYLDELTYIRCSAQLEENIARPWREVGKVDETQLLRKVELHGAILAKMLLPAVSRFQLHRELAVTRRALLHTVLGLEAYRQQTGRYPDSLADLARVSWPPPADVFSGQSLCYRRSDPGFVLYSVGPNGKDDGGQPAPWQNPKAKSRTVQPDDVGDIVWLDWRPEMPDR